MYEIFQALIREQPWGMIILVVLFGSVASVITGIAKEIRKHADHRKDAELKRELAERGLSVDEIERIVQARPAKPIEADGAA